MLSHSALLILICSFKSLAVSLLIVPQNCAISVITQIELFCSNSISNEEYTQLKKFVSVARIYNNIDEAIVNHTINIRKMHRIKTPDAIIAATALAYSLTLISRNTKDFENINGLQVINPHNL